LRTFLKTLGKPFLRSGENARLEDIKTSCHCCGAEVPLYKASMVIGENGFPYCSPASRNKKLEKKQDSRRRLNDF
jgi:hypothetical protein